MNPEFVAIMQEREQLGAWFTLFPACLGSLALIIAAWNSRKFAALLLVTLLAMFSVLVPVIVLMTWWDELGAAASSAEAKEWMLNHDGGGLLIAPLFASVLATGFWLVSALILLVRHLNGRGRGSNNGRSQSMPAAPS